MVNRIILTLEEEEFNEFKNNRKVFYPDCDSWEAYFIELRKNAN